MANRGHIASAALAAVFAIFCSAAAADVIHLKNGGKIKGVVVKDRGAGVIIDIGCGTVVQNKKDIARIDREDPVWRTAYPKKETAAQVRAPRPRAKLIEVFDFLMEGVRSVMRLDFLKRR